MAKVTITPARNEAVFVSLSMRLERIVQIRLRRLVPRQRVSH